MENNKKKNNTKRFLNHLLFLLLGFSMGIGVNHSKEKINLNSDEYNKVLNKINSLPIIGSTDSISVILEKEFGTVISEEAIDILDDKDIIQQVITLAGDKEIDIKELSNLASNLEDSAMKLVMQRIRESDARFAGDNLRFIENSSISEYELKANDTYYALDDNTLEKIIVNINNLRAYKQENGYVSITSASLEEQQHFVDDCVTVAYDMLQLCVNDVSVNNNLFSSDEVVLKIKK